MKHGYATAYATRYATGYGGPAQTPKDPVRFGWRTAARRLGPSPAFSTARRVSATRRED